LRRSLISSPVRAIARANDASNGQGASNGAAPWISSVSRLGPYGYEVGWRIVERVGAQATTTNRSS